MQNRHTEIASLLIKAGADISVRWATFGTARDIAESYECTALVETIDAELDRQLRARFVGFCDALSATKLPVLVVLESFAWFAACLLCLPCCSAAGLTLLASGVVEVEWLSTLFSSLRCDVPAMRNANSLDDENVDDDKDGDGAAVAAARRRRDVLNV